MVPGPILGTRALRPWRRTHAERRTIAAEARRETSTWSMLSTVALASAETACQFACSKLQLPMQTCRSSSCASLVSKGAQPERSIKARTPGTRRAAGCGHTGLQDVDVDAQGCILDG